MDYLQMLARWEELQQIIRNSSEEERQLRDLLFAGTFPQPVEGTNKYTLPDGRTVKGTYRLNRSLIEQKLPAVLAQLQLSLDAAPIRVKRELDLKKYRALPAEHQHIFSQAILTKAGAPTLELVYPGNTTEAAGAP